MRFFAFSLRFYPVPFTFHCLENMCRMRACDCMCVGEKYTLTLPLHHPLQRNEHCSRFKVSLAFSFVVFFLLLFLLKIECTQSNCISFESLLKNSRKTCENTVNYLLKWNQNCTHEMESAFFIRFYCRTRRREKKMNSNQIVWWGTHTHTHPHTRKSVDMIFLRSFPAVKMSWTRKMNVTSEWLNFPNEAKVCAQIKNHVIYCCAMCNIPWGELKNREKKELRTQKNTMAQTKIPKQQKKILYMVQHLVMESNEKLLDSDRDGRKDI